MRWFQPLTIALMFVTWSSARGEDVFLDLDFESETAGKAPANWRSFTAGTKPDVTVFDFGGGKALRGVRSDSSKLVALARDFDSPQQRVLIEFDLAISESAGRAFHLWTYEPGGRDASQLNLATHRSQLRHYGEGSWTDVGIRLTESEDAENPVWHRIRALVDAEANSVNLWFAESGSQIAPDAIPTAKIAYRSRLPIGGIGFVSGSRIAEDAWYLIDNLTVRGGADLPEPTRAPALPEAFPLWTGGDPPSDPEQIPFATGLENRTLHRAEEGKFQFLHGAAILPYKGVFYANWANSPVNENGPHETLQGRRSYDGGKTWPKLEVIGPGFDGPDRHSHGVLFEHQGELWTICARFGVGDTGRVFRGLKGEAFVLDEAEDRWESRGIVMDNCWPYDPPVKLENGSSITGGQDRDGLPVVAISQGDDFTKWDSVLIPYHPKLGPSFAETTVWAEGNRVLAVIRGGSGVAWVSQSEDGGRTWSIAGPSNYPMPRAKAFLGKLSTGQLFIVSNLRDRDTLVVSAGKPGELSVSRMWRIRHGKSEAPRFAGFAKSKQWSYPYACEHEGQLYVVYSIGKEDCGLSVIPVKSLAVE